MRHLHKNQKGSSLVLAIVAVTFVALLALSVIALTVSNIWMKQSETKSEKNLYHTDSVLDKIRAGLENDAENMSADAYQASMSKYTVSMQVGTSSLLDSYQSDYLNRMVKLLTGVNTTAGINQYSYNDSALTKYLTTEEQGAFVPHPSGKDVLLVEGSQIRLKNVQIKKIEDGYSTLITTDVVIKVPPITSSTHSEYLDYALIADNQVQFRDANNHSVDGNVYAGTVNRNVPGVSNPDTGILVSAGSNVNLCADTVISRGSILLDGGKLNVTKSGWSANDTGDSNKSNVWVENIKTEQDSVGNVLNMVADCNVANDLQINGGADSQGDQIKICGDYYGYNYKEDYNDNAVVSSTGNAKYSSAIILNGRNCNLDLLDLKQLCIAGRTYIYRGSNTEQYETTSNSINNPDIKLGESMTVKSTQLAYFVPKDYVTESNKNISGTSQIDKEKKIWYFKNVEDDMEQVYAFDYGMYMSKYLQIPDYNLIDYLNAATPLQSYYRNDLNTSLNSVKYFYLNFKSEKDSSEFYSKFRADSARQSTLASMEKTFANENGGILLDKGKAVMCLSGNILYRGKGSGSSPLQLVIGNDDPTDMSVSSVLRGYAITKSKEYMSRELTLFPDDTDVLNSSLYRLADKQGGDYTISGLSDHTNMFARLIDSNTFTTNTNDKAESMDVKVNKNKAKAAVVVQKGDYIWDGGTGNMNGATQGLIIASGNVTVNKNFTGLIIAGGNIDIKNGANVKADGELLTAMFAKDKKAAQPLFFNYFTEYVRKSMGGAIETADDDSDGTVGYENWTKN